MISDPGFPRLVPGNHRVTSPPTPRYNCIAWSAGDVDRWWQPGIFWPVESSTEDYDVEALEEAFESLGYLKTFCSARLRKLLVAQELRGSIFQFSTRKLAPISLAG
jgi:hypothetical protein